ncbi:apolipoprotein N-acyltransferase [Nitrospira sp. Kam-Ns4a]
MTAARLRPTALAALTGLLYPLCFPDYDLGALAWVVLVPLHLAIASATPRRAFWLGWLAGTIAFAGLMAWVVTAMHLYGKMPLVASYPVMLLLAAYLGAYVAVYAAAVAWLRAARPALAFAAAPFVWVASELLRTYLLSGLPWALLGYSQYRWLPVIQIADLTGVYGVSFLVVLMNGALAELVLWGLGRARGQATMPVPWLSSALAALGLMGALWYGSAALAGGGRPGEARTIRIGVVQANIDQAQKWDLAYRRATLDRYIRLTGQAAAETDLVVWPEAATPFLFEQELPYRTEVTELVRRHAVPLLFGSPALRYFPSGRPYLLNSAYLLAPDGAIVGRYDKRHLVPFGEYIPLKSSLLFFLDKLVEGIGDFEPGPGPTILSIPLAADGRSAPPAKFGVAICYEVIFPDLVREAAAEGAEFMVTITNDAWFGSSAAPYQHFGMVVLRAVENRIAFARAANTGISGFIAPTGRILEATPIFQELVVQGRVPVTTTRTVYTRHGDIFAYFCVIIAGIFLVTGQMRRGRETPAHEQAARA